MVKGQKNLLTETSIKGFMLMVNLVDLGSITGLMEVISKVYLKMA